MTQFTIQNEVPERLDVVLARMFGISRTQAQKKIGGMTILINGKKATAHTLVSSMDTIEAEDNDVETGFKPVYSKAETIQAMPKLEILYEDADVLVVVKPAGIVMHKVNEADTQLTMVDLACAHAPQIAKIGDNTLRPGVVHRLDRQASGVVVFAKTPEAFLHLKQQFQGRQTIKKYTVLVNGKVADEHGTITFPIARSQAMKRMAARPHSQAGKEAITNYTVMQRYTASTLLDVHIETGRTHQIRAHMLAIGHPVVGDTMYVRKGEGRGKAKLGRLFLHARELTLTLPSGETRVFEAVLPLELEEYLASLQVEYHTSDPASPSRKVAG